MALGIINVYQYHTTLILKYVCKFSNFVMSIILSQIYSICWILFFLLNFFYYINFKFNQIYFKQTKIIQLCCLYAFLKKIVKTIYTCDYNLGRA
jgi:hypothetical protein